MLANVCKGCTMAFLSTKTTIFSALLFSHSHALPHTHTPKHVLTLCFQFCISILHLPAQSTCDSVPNSLQLFAKVYVFPFCAMHNLPLCLAFSNQIYRRNLAQYFSSTIASLSSGIKCKLFEQKESESGSRREIERERMYECAHTKARITVLNAPTSGEFRSLLVLFSMYFLPICICFFFVIFTC